MNEKRMGPKNIPLDDLVPHPLNSNVMPDDLREKLRAHIRRTGNYPHVVVRPHPTETGRHQVLDSVQQVFIRGVGVDDGGEGAHVTSESLSHEQIARFR